MKTKLMFVLMGLSLGLTSYAAPKSVKIKSKKKIKRAPIKVDASSMALREGKKYSFNGSLAGITHNSVSQSVEGAYHLNRDLQITFQYSHLESGIATYDEGKYSDNELDVWKRNGKGTSLSAGAKKFYGNSFYAKAEGYYRNQDHINKTGSKVKPGTKNEWVVVYKETGRIEDIGISLKVGNQWQWQDFTVGVDWIGLNRSITTISKRGTIEDDDMNSLNLANIYLGASF